MDLITLSTEIKQYFQLKSAHITMDNNDFMVMLQKISKELVVFTCPELSLEEGQIIILIFSTKYGKVECEIKIESFYTNETMISVEGKINSKNDTEFFIVLENLYNTLLDEKKRKEERILCTQKNIKLLHLLNVVFLNFNFKKYKGIIKDISFSGIKLLINPIFLNEKNELFTFKIQFTKPEESFMFVKCPVVRKNLYVFENYEFAEIVLKLPINIKYQQRITSFLNANSYKLERKR